MDAAKSIVCLSRNLHDVSKTGIKGRIYFLCNVLCVHKNTSIKHIEDFLSFAQKHFCKAGTTFHWKGTHIVAFRLQLERFIVLIKATKEVSDLGL